MANAASVVDSESVRRFPDYVWPWLLLSPQVAETTCHRSSRLLELILDIPFGFGPHNQIQRWCNYRCFLVQDVGHFLILKIHDELDLAGTDTLDRSAKPGKRNGAGTEKGIDCGRAYMVEEVEELCG